MSWSSSKQIWPSYSSFLVWLHLEQKPCGGDLDPALRTERREPKQTIQAILNVRFVEGISLGRVSVRGPIGDPQLKGSSQGLRTPMYPYVALRGPTYHENSHANHTWHPQSHQTACSTDSEAPPVWVRFPSPAPLPAIAGQCQPMQCQDAWRAVRLQTLASTPVLGRAW